MTCAKYSSLNTQKWTDSNRQRHRIPHLQTITAVLKRNEDLDEPSANRKLQLQATQQKARRYEVLLFDIFQNWQGLVNAHAHRNIIYRRKAIAKPSTVLTDSPMRYPHSSTNKHFWLPTTQPMRSVYPLIQLPRTCEHYTYLIRTTTFCTWWRCHDCNVSNICSMHQLPYLA